MDLSLKKVTGQQWGTFLIHLILICCIFFLPDMMSNYSRPKRNPDWALMGYAKAAMMVAVFYANYLFIIRRTLFDRHRNGVVIFTIVNIALIAGVLLANYLMADWLGLTHYGKHKDLPMKLKLMREGSFYLRDAVMVMLTIALSVALRFTGRLSQIEKKHERLLAMQRDDELKNLRHQLNPHFLFNTLNTIYSLIDISPGSAKDAVHRLSKMLRYMLYENPARVRLSQEIDFIRNYISLMEERLGPGVVSASFDTGGYDPRVAPLLFITTVENAMKYGNTGRRDDKIEIAVKCGPDGVVTCTTRNHFVAVADGNKRGSGIGLANLRRRLSLIYGDKASLAVSVTGDIYTSVITIDTK